MTFIAAASLIVNGALAIVWLRSERSTRRAWDVVHQVMRQKALLPPADPPTQPQKSLRN